MTSVGYAILEKVKEDKYTLIDYGVSMFDSPIDKDGKSKKLLHNTVKTTAKLYNLKKRRKINLAEVFEKFGFGKKELYLTQEKNNIYRDKWYLRAEKVFTERLSYSELFSILYLITKHRGYKSLDTDDLIEELLKELSFDVKEKVFKKNDEKGEIKKALQSVEKLREEYPEKTVARIIYEMEIKKDNPTFRNHDNYNYMIRRKYIRDEIRMIIEAQNSFGLFDDTVDISSLIKELILTIDDQKESTNALELFNNCEYYPEYKVSHQYSLLSDIFKMYQAVSSITLDKTRISEKQITLIVNDIFNRIKEGKPIISLRYKDIRQILDLEDEIKIFEKNDFYINKKGKKIERNISKFYFLPNLGKIDNTFIKNILDKENKYEILKEVFDVLEFKKAPKLIYKYLKEIFIKYNLVENEKSRDETIVNLIKYKNGKSLNISAFAMMQFIPYLKKGFVIDEIKDLLNLEANKDYSHYKKGIKYLQIKMIEEDNNLTIKNHASKYVVSSVMRLIKHLHKIYGSFDEIRLESNRDLSQNKETRKAIEKATREYEKKFQNIMQNEIYIDMAKEYERNLSKYAKKLMMWEDQEKYDIYSGKIIGYEDIFTDLVDIDYIIPKNLGGLSLKHNFVLTFKKNITKNQLPIYFVKDKKAYIDRVEYLYNTHKINWKKKKNLLATTLDEAFQDTLKSNPNQSTSYIETLTAEILKRYYPFENKEKLINGEGVRHTQGKSTTNIRKFLNIELKVKDTNIYHAIYAILMGISSESWLQGLLDTFKKNVDTSNDIAKNNIQRLIPTINKLSPKKLIENIENNYNFYGEKSIFYKDIWNKTKVVSFWISKKPMISKIHKDTVYSKKPHDLFTVRENIIRQFELLKINIKTDSTQFMKNFEKKILHKMYLYKTNPNDVICKIVQKRAEEIKILLDSFVFLDKKDKKAVNKASEKIDILVHKDLLDQNGNSIKRVKFYQSNLTGFNVRGGLVIKEKTFIGFKANLENEKIVYERIDASNFKKIQEINDGSFKVYKNDIVFFIYKDESYKGGKIVSFLEDKSMASFSNPKFPGNIQQQPDNFIIRFQGKPNSHKQHSITKAIGIIKLKLDILGNIESYSTIGKVSKELKKKILH